MINELGLAVNPPQGSFDPFLEVLRKLRGEGVPKIIENRYFKDVTGQSHMYTTKSAMQFFELIDNKGASTPKLLEFLSHLDDKSVWHQLYEEGYPQSVTQGLPNVESRDDVKKLLGDAFPDSKPSTQYKGTIFLLKMAGYAGVSIPALGINRPIDITQVVELPQPEEKKLPPTTAQTNSSAHTGFEYDYIKRFDFDGNEHVTLLYKLDPLRYKPTRQQEFLQGLMQLIQKYEGSDTVDTS